MSLSCWRFKDQGKHFVTNELCEKIVVKLYKKFPFLGKQLLNSTSRRAFLLIFCVKQRKKRSVGTVYVQSTVHITYHRSSRSLQ